MRFYFYKMMVDSGSGPCVTDRLLTLAICKPKIRASGRIGDWVFGFGSKTTLGSRLIYIAEITDKLNNGEYYRMKAYQHREDCIYQWNGERLEWKPGSRHHINGSRKDIGDPPWNQASVLVSEDFRYFGCEGTTDYMTQYPVLARAIEKLGQGHRVNHGELVEKELDKLRLEMWEKYPDQMKIGLSTALKNTNAGEPEC